MRLALIAIVLAACTDEPSSSGPNVTSHIETLTVAPGTPGCFTGSPIDADASTPGAQYDCSVTRTASGAVYPQCNSGMTNQPCWQIAQSASCSTAELQIIPSVTEGVTAQCIVQ